MGEELVDDVVDAVAAIGVDGVIDFVAGAEAADDEWYFVFDDQFEVFFEAVVGFVDDEVDGEGGGGALGVGGVVCGEAFLDFGEPFVELFEWAGVEGWHGADDAGGALRHHQIGHGDDEEGRGDDGQAQAALQHVEQAHGA